MLSSIYEYRRRSLWIKYIPMIIGLGLFISGLFVTLNTSLVLFGGLIFFLLLKHCLGSDGSGVVPDTNE